MLIILIFSMMRGERHLVGFLTKDLLFSLFLQTKFSANLLSGVLFFPLIELGNLKQEEGRDRDQGDEHLEHNGQVVHALNLPLHPLNPLLNNLLKKV